MLRALQVFALGAGLPGQIFTWDLFQAQLSIVLLGNPVALTGGVLKFIAVHDLYCATGVLDEVVLLQNASRRAYAGSIGS